MQEIIFETVIDAVKMLPFLLGAYLLIEYIEHRSAGRLEKLLGGSGKFGAVGGAVLGCIPQCGFSAAAANLYAGRIITLGTLIAVFLSTSDEAIPLLLANPDHAGTVLKLIGIKIVIAIVAGIGIDLLFRPKPEHNHEHIHDLCADCECEEEGIFKSALHHTLHIFVFIVAVSFVLNLVIALLGEDKLAVLLMSNSIFQPAIAAVIGFIPNCASSVVMTQLYLSGTISFGSIVAGLCTNAGVGLAVLFKVNRNTKENFKILGILYIIGVGAGMVIQLMGIA